MISVINLSKKYKDREVLKNINFVLDNKESLGIIGKNGAGKTTLMNIILNKIKPTTGEIKLDYSLEQACYKIGVQMQNAYFESLLKVKEIIKLYCDLYRLDSININKMLEKYNLIDKQNNYVSKLSGGEKQKLNIILATIHNPEYLFFDEITTGLDPISREKIYSEMKKLKNENKQIVLVSHYFEEIWNVCDNLLILENGCVGYYGKTKAFANNMDDFNKKILNIIKE